MTVDLYAGIKWFSRMRNSGAQVCLPALVALVTAVVMSTARGQTETKSTLKEYEWGSVASQNDGKGLILSVSINAVTKTRTAAAIGDGTSAHMAGNARFIQTQPVFPQYAFYLAIPPNTSLRIGTISARTVIADPNVPVVVAGYQSASDSSSLDPVLRSLAQVASIPTTAVLSVTGYEWYRGYRLARMLVSPYQQQASGYRFAESVESRLEFQSTPLSSPTTKSSDPQFDPVFKTLVANEEELPLIGQTGLASNDTTGDWIPWGNRAIKLGIAQDGVYRLTFRLIDSLLSTAGLIDPTTFRVFNRGVEIPIYVAGEQDGQFSPGDYMEFPALKNYGRNNYRSIPSGNQEYPDYLDRYTDTSAYWLTWGSSKGLRMDSSGAVPSSTDTLAWYTELVHMEQNNQLQFADGSNLVVRQDPRWTSGDIWGWNWLFAGSVFNVPFVASNIYNGYPTARISARCASTTWPFSPPSYKVRLRVNASDTLQKIDDTGLTPQILMQADAPIGLLVNGTNTIRVHSLATASSVNAIWFDWAEAEYPRNLTTSGDTLIFGFPWLTSTGLRTVVVAGLSNPGIVVYKYSPRLKRISNLGATGVPPFQITFTDTIAPGDRYMLWSAAKVKTPQTMAVKSFPNLRDPTRGADYILITSKKFLSIANSYAAFIGATYAFHTAVVDVDDIFNEFGYGYPTGESIREFLKATTAWQAPMPSYVFLVGDGTYDYKHFMANPNPDNLLINSVPTLGEPVSDPWLTVFDDSSLIPQMYIGRIPVNTENDFSRYFQRVQAYVAARNDDWNKRYMFFAGGDPGVTGQVESFRQTNESIITSMVKPAPIAGVASDFYKTKSPQTDFGPYSPDQVQNAIDSGAVFICYIGHSGTQTWDNSIGSITQLQNTRNRQPLITDFGCSTAKFAEPDIKCFGELFTLDPQGSAIAYVGNTALGFVSIALTLPPLFYRQFLVNQNYEIGKAHLLAKIAAMNQMGGPSVLLNRVMVLTNSLLGDPAIELAIPKKPNVVINAGSISTSPASPSDDQDSFRLVVPYMNTGRAIPDTLAINVRHTYEGVTTDTTLLRPLPLFFDTAVVAYSSKDRAGDHGFTIRLNPDGRVPEIQTDDNTAVYSSAVLSTAVRIVRPLPGYEYPAGDLVFLNPVKQAAVMNPALTLEIDTSAAFSAPLQLTQPFGEVTTTVSPQSLLTGRKYHWRAGITGSSAPKVLGDFTFGAAGVTRWHPADSVDWNINSYVGARYVRDQGVTIADKVIDLQVISAGFDDGTFGAVNINSINVLPNSFGRGHNVVLLDTTDLSVKNIRVYDTFASSAQSDSLAAYLNALPTGSLVVVLIIDEGTNSLTASARAAIKSIGSHYIDSVKFRDSWAIIGTKGAPQGSVLEQWKKAFSGKAEVDTTYIRKVNAGTVTSPHIGPVGAWKSLAFSGNTPAGAILTVGALGLRPNGTQDTLVRGQAGPTVDLSGYSTRIYPKIRLVGSLVASPGGQSPELTDWSVSVDPPAELAMNYQSVSLSADSVLEGTSATVSANVYNVGSVPADSVYVRLSSIGASGFRLVDSVYLGTVVPNTFKTSNFIFPTAGKLGSNTLIVEVDPQQHVNELYKSNNILSLPLYVRADTVRPTFTVTFDGGPVYNGDYVSATPTIVIAVFDNSPLPLTNPAEVQLILDDQLVTLGTNPDSLFEPLGGPDKARVTYKPRLAKGDHMLSIQVKDATGNFADTTAKHLTFKVETEPGLLNVLNYPNPFAHETQFTFNLVGTKLPDQLKVKIYSVAGRLIQEIDVWGSQLRFGFNRIPWDGRDREGDEIANGVYLYKVVMTVDGKSEEVIQKLAKVR